MKANTYRESLDAVLAASHALEGEEVSFRDALGRVPVADVRAVFDDPPAPKSAMDGFALRAGDTASASPERPVAFDYSEVVGAGHVASRAVAPGGAVRIMTGALLPEGADAVVKQEDTQPEMGGAGGERGRFRIAAPLRPGENVFGAGSRFMRGDRLLAAGEPITAQGAGLCAGQGLTRLHVHRRPRVVLLALGDELVEPGTAPRPGQIFVSNLHALAAEAGRQGAEVSNLGIAPDDPSRIEGMLRPHFVGRSCADLVLTLGGSHQGDFDFVGEVLGALGAAVHFQRTLIGWGGSTVFATRDGTLCFGLPGTPLASWLAFEVLVRPALWRMAGRTKLDRPVFPARLSEAVWGYPGRTHFVPVRLEFVADGPPLATPLEERPRGSRKSSLLADGFVLYPDGAERLEAGALVTVAWLGG
jgi:molybdopterin molybdotransferase